MTTVEFQLKNFIQFNLLLLRKPIVSSVAKTTTHYHLMQAEIQISQRFLCKPCRSQKTIFFSVKVLCILHGLPLAYYLNLSII